MPDPQRSVKARLEQVRTEIDALLEGEGERDLSEIKGVVFGLADGDHAEVRATQERVSDPPPPSIRILGEFIDGMAGAHDQPPRQVSEYAIRMMEESKRTEQYDQMASIWREDHDE